MRDGREWPSRPRHLSRGALGSAVLTLYVVTYCAWLLEGWGGPHRAAAISDAAFLPMSLLAACFSWRAARRRDGGRERRAWRLIGASYVCYWAGDVGWFYFDAVRGSRPYPSLADAAYLSFYPCIAAGLIALAPKPASWREWAVAAMDTLTVTLGGLLVVVYLVVEPTVAADAAARAPWLAKVLDVAYPLGDVIVLYAMVAVLLSRRDKRPELSILTAGLCLFITADLAYARMSLVGSYTDRSWVNALWMAGQALTIVSAGLAGRTGPMGDPVAPTATEHTRRVSRLPFAGVATALVLLQVVSAEDLSRRYIELVAGVVLMTALVAVRQLTALQDNNRLLAQLRLAAETDHLTGLASRPQFFKVAEEVVGGRPGPGPVALLMVDVDQFKTVNDTFGHLNGDAVLQQVARCVTGCVRAGDLVARLGGDELAVLLPDCSPEALVDIADRLVNAVREAKVANGKIRFSVSVGGAVLDGSTNLAQGIEQADKALYCSKRNGKDNWTIGERSGRQTALPIPTPGGQLVRGD